jgi:hypothetical protein
MSEHGTDDNDNNNYDNENNIKYDNDDNKDNNTIMKNKLLCAYGNSYEYIYIPVSYAFLWLMRNIEESGTVAYIQSV